MRKVKKTCILCGTQYEYCYHCNAYRDLPTFYNMYCSKNCRDVFTTIAECVGGNMSKEDAIIKLNSCDLTKRDMYSENIEKDLNTIIPKKIENVMPEPEVQDVKEENKTEAPVEEIKEKTVNTTATTSVSKYSSNKNKYYNNQKR